MADGSHAGENPVTVSYHGVHSNGQGQDEKDVADGGPTESGGNPPSGGIAFDVLTNKVNWVSDGHQHRQPPQRAFKVPHRDHPARENSHEKGNHRLRQRHH